LQDFAEIQDGQWFTQKRIETLRKASFPGALQTRCGIAFRFHEPTGGCFRCPSLTTTYRIRVCGQRDQKGYPRERIFLGLDGEHGRSAVHDRHLKIQKNQVEFARRDLVDGFLAVVGSDHLTISKFPENLFR
jgi:hypothetical protein